VQTVTCEELKTPNCGEELTWTALPKLCRKCFRVKRKPVRTENVMSKSRCDSDPQSLPKVQSLNASSECGDENDCLSNPVLSQIPVTLTDSMLLSAETSCIDNTICSSVKTTVVASPFTSTSLNSSCNLLSTKPPSIGSKNDSKTPQSGFVPPLFKNSKFDAQLKEAEIHRYNVAVTAPGNMNKTSDLHRCPLCDMVFDMR